MAGLVKMVSVGTCARMMLLAVLLAGTIPAVAAPVPAAGKIHTSIDQRLSASKDGTVRAWVFFTDKGFSTAQDEATAISRLDTTYDSRALTRRLHRRTDPGLTDARDLPVSQAYIDAVAATGATVRHPSRWLNAISVVGTREQLTSIAGLTIVTKVQAVRQSQRVQPESVGPAEPAQTSQSALAGVPFYGESEEQIMQIELDQLHNLGFTGDGIVVGVLDTGFLRTHNAFNHSGHPVQIVAEHDFINNDGNTANQPGDPGSQHNHGTWILGTLGAYKPTELVGAAYDASFILCKTEDVSSETQIEEDNYVAGLEFIELNGGDMATASLSYSDWYTAEDYDGLTAVTTIAVNTATANGMYCLNSAANGGHDSNPTTATIGAPADAFQVLSVGAADSAGVIAGFSSDGPSADGRIKPEILARGVNTRTVDVFSNNLYVGVGGTSLSCPLAAGAVACLIEAHPTWTVQQMRTYLMLTADDYILNGTYDPLYVRGFGVINAFAASQQDCDGNAVNDLTDIANLTHPDCNANSIPDVCDLQTEHSRDANGNNIPDECEPPANDNCANAIVPLECQNMTPNPNLGTCSVSAGPPNINEICDLSIGTFPRHDCVNPAAVCGPVPGGSDAFRCQFVVDNRLATTDGPTTTGSACAASGTDAFQSDVWFTYVPPCDGTLTIQNCADNDYDSLIQVFSNGTGTCPSCPITDNALSVECNDDHCGVVGGGSAVAVGANCNDCYTIRIGGANSPAGLGTSTVDLGIACHPDGCGGHSQPPAPPPVPHNRPKNRYISFAPNNGPDILVSFRVQKTTPPTGSCWVQTPVQTGPDQYTAKCDATPVVRVWLEPVIHVGDCEIIPAANYNVFGSNALQIDNPIPFSTQTSPLPALNGKLWGDAVGSNNGIEWTPPNQFTNVQDVLAILAYISNAAVKPHFTVANLQAISAPDSCLNTFINTADVLISVAAIAGSSYGPPSTGKIVDPTLCPVCP